MKLFTALLSTLSLCVSPSIAASRVEPGTEFGDINGASFRIDIPQNWNRGLVIYAHGYAPTPIIYKEGNLSPALAVFADQGYAVAQSGYTAGGWAVKEAENDIEALRRHFIAKYGRPKETFITGHSMGGFLTMMLLERHPDNYDAGLALCGPLAPTNYFLARGAFDLRVVFDYYFPGMLPPPDKVPASFKNTPELTAQVTELLHSSPEKAASMRRYSALRSDKDVAETVTFLTYVLKDLQERSGGNPFDNRSVIYEGVEDYNALNDGVKRYSADARAAQYVRTWYTPTGHLSRPLLAIHTTYDPLVPVRIPNMYPEIAEQAGTPQMFVQQYVRHDGHCAILPGEISHGFSELRAWKDQGARPSGGAE